MNQPKTLPAEFADGNQAIAWAAIDANVQYASHYPGSPVNRVIPVLEADDSSNIIINHALNEHIAALATMGASVCGARSLLVMKHVGLNIAADPLNYAAVSNISGAMVVVVGTDPGARSSTGEEDVHWYAPQFNFPLLEPASVQGIYDTVKKAFVISENNKIPVLVFVVGRLAYQSALVQRDTQPPMSKPLSFNKDPDNLINVGKRAVSNHRAHLLRIQAFAKQASRVETLYEQSATYGIITRGATFAIVCELVEELQLQQQLQVLNIERSYPLNIQEIINFSKNKTTLTIIEDQDGFLETMLKRDAFGKINCTIHGKNIFPAWDEISIQQVKDFLSQTFQCHNTTKPLSLNINIPERPGTFCEGCPHRSAFYAIDQALQEKDGIIGGDIGCSSLPPHRTDWLLCMNAGVGMSQGIAQMLPQRSLVSTGGEGSLFHGGLSSLQSAVENNITLTHILFDNKSIAMTGHQASPTASSRVNIKMLLVAIGVNQVFEVNAFEASRLTSIIQHAQSLDGVKVVWVRGDCALQPNSETLRRRRERTLDIDNDLCGSCSRCYSKLQCPAIVKQHATSTLMIDMQRCMRCGACLDVCPNNAIRVTDTELELQHE